MSAKGAGSKAKRRRVPIEQYDLVSTMLIGMVPYSTIEKQCSMKWAKTRAYVQRVIAQVHEDWAESASLVKDTRKHQVRQAFETLYMKATADKDVNAAARILREIGLLDGCYATAKVDVTMNGAVGVGISLGSLGFKSPEEVAARIEHLRAMVATQGVKALAAGMPQAAAQALLKGQPVPNFTSPSPQTAGTNGASEHVEPLIIDVPPNDEPEGGQS